MSLKKKSNKSEKISTVSIDVRDDGNSDIDIGKEDYALKATAPENLTLMSNNGTARIVVVVAEKLLYNVGTEQKSFKMEAGRIAAQVGHTVSALKMLYVQNNADNKSFGGIRGLVGLMLYNPITTIVLGARDNNEVYHIMNLAAKAQILYEGFWDENSPVYGTDERLLTAVAIGPIHKEALTGITDYLPLYKAAGEA